MPRSRERRRPQPPTFPSLQPPSREPRSQTMFLSRFLYFPRSLSSCVPFSLCLSFFLSFLHVFIFIGWIIPFFSLFRSFCPHFATPFTLILHRDSLPCFTLFLLDLVLPLFISRLLSWAGRGYFCFCMRKHLSFLGSGFPGFSREKGQRLIFGQRGCIQNQGSCICGWGFLFQGEFGRRRNPLDFVRRWHPRDSTAGFYELFEKDGSMPRRSCWSLWRSTSSSFMLFNTNFRNILWKWK